MKKAFQLATALILIFILGEAAIFAVGLLPQEPIKASIEESLPQLELEYSKQYVLHDKSRNGIGNFTDCLILNLSYYSDTKTDPMAMLSNPRFREKGESTVSDLHMLTGGNAANSNYINYCMGFRVWMRPLLTVFNYMQIRSILSSLLWVLFGFSIFTVFRVTKSEFFSALYVICFVALNPLGIAGTLSYMDCYLIAFLGVLLVPSALRRAERSSIYIPMMFLALGAVTQFFDFYTNPLITFAFPMIVLLYAQQASRNDIAPRDSFRVFLSGFAVWMIGYVGIWLLKLLSTAVLTNLDVLSVTTEVLHESFGISKTLGTYFETLTASARNILTPEILIALVIAVGVGVVRFVKQPNRKINLNRSWVFLAIGAISLVWVLFSKRTIEHINFQYRTFGVLILGVFAFLSSATDRHPSNTESL